MRDYIKEIRRQYIISQISNRKQSLELEACDCDIAPFRHLSRPKIPKDDTLVTHG